MSIHAHTNTRAQREMHAHTNTRTQTHAHRGRCTHTQTRAHRERCTHTQTHAQRETHRHTHTERDTNTLTEREMQLGHKEDYLVSIQNVFPHRKCSHKHTRTQTCSSCTRSTTSSPYPMCSHKHAHITHTLRTHHAHRHPASAQGVLLRVNVRERQTPRGAWRSAARCTVAVYS